MSLTGLIGFVLYFPDVADGGDDGEDGELFEDRGVVPVVFGVDEVGVHVVVCVVDAEVDGASAVLEFFVPVEADVHTVVAGHAVVVARGDVVGRVAVVYAVFCYA